MALTVAGFAQAPAVRPARPELMIDCPATLQPGAAMRAVVHVRGARGPMRVSWAIRTDAGQARLDLPDSVRGVDRAIGARSWTEMGGQIIEEGSLTDGIDYTDASTGWQSAGISEAVQFVDLGSPRHITSLSLLAGDANHAYRLDIAGRREARGEWTPLPGLQEVDLHGRWGRVELALGAPITLRHLRLRYHDQGRRVSVLAMPRALSAWTAATRAELALPSPGAPVAAGSLSIRDASRSAVTVALPRSRALSAGAYLLLARAEAACGCAIAARRFYVHGPPMRSPGRASRFGLNVADPKYQPLLARLGIGWVRFENLKWPFFSPAPGDYRFDGSVPPWRVNLDAILRGWKSVGVSVLPFLFMTADYASSAGPEVKPERRWAYPPRTPGAFGEFAFQVAARYGARTVPPGELRTTDGATGLGLLSHYEIWNEPNLTDPGWGPWVGTREQYLGMLREAAEAIRRADPGARISAAGYAGIQVHTVSALARPWPDGSRPVDMIDLLNVHFYSGRVPPEIATDDFNARESGNLTFEEEMRRLARWRDGARPGLPIWLSETGYDSDGPYGTDERTQAARLPRVVMLALASGAEKVFVYRESGSTPSQHSASGLLRNDGTPKPAWFTYATLIRQMNGVTGGALRVPQPDPNVRVLAWRTPGGPLLTAWTVRGEATCALDFGPGRVVDAFGLQRRLAAGHGLRLSEFPLYIWPARGSRPAAMLAAAASARARREATQRAWQAAAPALAIKFGGSADGMTVDIGTERAYEVVHANDLWMPGRTCGFAPGPALGDETQPWINEAIDRTFCKTGDGQSFRVALPSGRYHMRLGISPFAPARITLNGGDGADRTVSATRGSGVIETDLEVGRGPLSIACSGYAGWRWLTLAACPPREPRRPRHAEGRRAILRRTGPR